MHGKGKKETTASEFVRSCLIAEAVSGVSISVSDVPGLTVKDGGYLRYIPMT